MSAHRNASQRTQDATTQATSRCEYCGTPYEPKKPQQRFCSPKCRQGSWEQSHPRVAIGAVKLEGKPTADQLEAAGIPVRRAR